MVSLADVDERLQKIYAVLEGPAYDPEVAHSLEDALHAEVLQAIADGAETPAALAAKALESKMIEFERHCA